MIENGWTKRCQCGRGILEAVRQCSYCDELDDRAARRKAAIQTQHRLNKAPSPAHTWTYPQQCFLTDRLASSFYVSFESKRPKHLASYQPLEENARLLQELLGGYVYDVSLWDYSDGPRVGWTWQSRDRDRETLIEWLWPLLPASRQLYLLDKDQAPR